MTRFIKGQPAWNKKEGVVLYCHNCNKKMVRRPSEQNKFCSRSCYWKSKIGTKNINRQIEVECSNCKKKYSLPPSHKKDQNFCSKKCWYLYKKTLITPLETRRKQSESHLLRREKSNFWKGGITKISQAIRNSFNMTIWRESVFKRDDWTCQECEKRGGILNAHHILSFAKFIDYRFDINNGTTLCQDCHKKTDTYLCGV